VHAPRLPDLGKVAGNFAPSQLPGSIEWETLVVENNSRDQTFQVTEGFSYRFPGRFRYVCESTPGKSYAPNSGIHEAAEDILAFTHDDVTGGQHWSQNLTGSSEGREWAGAGRRILHVDSVSPAPWPAFDGPFGMGGIVGALFDHGERPGNLDEAPFGANMAFRTTYCTSMVGFG